MGRVRKPHRKSIVRSAVSLRSDYGLATRKRLIRRFISVFRTFPSCYPSYIAPSSFPTTVHRQKITEYASLAVGDRFVTCPAIFIARIATGDVLATPKHKAVF
jgi:hypothetical protein